MISYRPLWFPLSSKRYLLYYSPEWHYDSNTFSCRAPVNYRIPPKFLSDFSTKRIHIDHGIRIETSFLGDRHFSSIPECNFLAKNKRHFIPKSNLFKLYHQMMKNINVIETLEALGEMGKSTLTDL